MSQNQRVDKMRPSRVVTVSEVKYLQTIDNNSITYEQISNSILTMLAALSGMNFDLNVFGFKFKAAWCLNYKINFFRLIYLIKSWIKWKLRDI